MKTSDYVAPKWWLATKRGIGMAMVGSGTVVPVLAGFFGLTIDAATWGELTAAVAQWFDVTWTIVGFGLWVWGSVFPTAPLSLSKPS